jgi:hypothetical protein
MQPGSAAAAGMAETFIDMTRHGAIVVALLMRRHDY